MRIEKEEAIELIKQERTKELPIGWRMKNIDEELRHSARMARLKAIKEKDIIEMRKSWSEWILFCVVLIVVWDLVVIGLIGIGWLEYKNSYIIPSFLAESIIKVLGLAIIIVNFLFSKNKNT